MAGTSALLIAAVERSKVPFFVAGGVLVAWALVSVAIGMRRSSFPGRPQFATRAESAPALHANLHRWRFPSAKRKSSPTVPMSQFSL